MASISHMFCRKNKVIMRYIGLGDLKRVATCISPSRNNLLCSSTLSYLCVCPKNSQSVNKLTFYNNFIKPVSINFCTKTTSAGITDDILKSKFKDQTQQNDPQPDSSKNEQKKKDSWFSSKNSWKIGLISMAGMGILIAGNLMFVWGAPGKDTDGTDLRDEFTDLPKWQAYPKRFAKEFVFFKKMIVEPSSAKLLPDPVKEPYYQPPYTVVFELTGILVHPDWTLGTGWRFKKRPHIDYLFHVLQSPGLPLFEIVVYTHEGGMTAYPIVDGIDPNNHVSYRLFRDATRYIDGTHCKDLSCLNRDESKVIIVDCDPKAVQLQPRNSINMKKWLGEDQDTGLIELGNFLRTIAASSVDDVRTVLDYYNQYDDPLQAFRDKQKQLQEQQELASRSVAEANKSKGFIGSWSAGFGRRGH